MTPYAYRWLSYGGHNGRTTGWRIAVNGHLDRACRALRMPGEVLEVVYARDPWRKGEAVPYLAGRVIFRVKDRSARL